MQEHIICPECGARLAVDDEQSVYYCVCGREVLKYDAAGPDGVGADDVSMSEDNGDDISISDVVNDISLVEEGFSFIEKDLIKAEKSLQKALKINPDNAKAWLGLAYVELNTPHINVLPSYKKIENLKEDFQSENIAKKYIYSTFKFTELTRVEIPIKILNVTNTKVDINDYFIIFPSLCLYIGTSDTKLSAKYNIDNKRNINFYSLELCFPIFDYYTSKLDGYLDNAIKYSTNSDIIEAQKLKDRYITLPKEILSKIKSFPSKEMFYKIDKKRIYIQKHEKERIEAEKRGEDLKKYCLIYLSLVVIIAITLAIISFFK
jgi:tetratricopeptide (TPR) repeat protein